MKDSEDIKEFLKSIGYETVSVSIMPMDPALCPEDVLESIVVSAYIDGEVFMSGDYYNTQLDGDIPSTSKLIIYNNFIDFKCDYEDFEPLRSLDKPDWYKHAEEVVTQIKAEILESDAISIFDKVDIYDDEDFGRFMVIQPNTSEEEDLCLSIEDNPVGLDEIVEKLKTLMDDYEHDDSELYAGEKPSSISEGFKKLRSKLNKEESNDE